MTTRKIISIIVFVLYLQSLWAQEDVSVEKSAIGIYTGVLGAWGNYEVGISKSVTIRSEIGLDAGLFGGDYFNNTGIILVPVVNVEPRFYYNIKKRGRNGQNTKNNNANFVTLSLSYHPDWFEISNYDNIGISEQISVIPKWGIRRNISESNFNYEAGIGLGYRQYFLKQYGYKNNESEAALDIHLRIGYTF